MSNTGIPGVLSSGGQLHATLEGAVAVPTGIPGVFADDSGNLCITDTPSGVGVPTGIANVLANLDGRLRTTTSPVGTLRPCGIPNGQADSEGSLYIETTTTDPTDLPTGIPGVFASVAHRIRVATVAGEGGDALLNEDDSVILLEDGGELLLEG